MRPARRRATDFRHRWDALRNMRHARPRATSFDRRPAGHRAVLEGNPLGARLTGQRDADHHIVLVFLIVPIVLMPGRPRNPSTAPRLSHAIALAEVAEPAGAPDLLQALRRCAPSGMQAHTLAENARRHERMNG